MVCAVVADGEGLRRLDGLDGLDRLNNDGLVANAQALLQGSEEAAEGGGVAWKLDASGAAALVVYRGVVLAVPAVQVARDGASVDCSSGAEGAVVPVSLGWVGADVAVACVTLEVVDHEHLVVVKVARHGERIRDVNWGGHRVGTAQPKQTSCQRSGGGGLSRDGEVGGVHDVRS